MFARNTEIFRIRIDTYDQSFQTFLNGFGTAEIWCIVGLATILRLLQRKNSAFFNL